MNFGEDDRSPGDPTFSIVPTVSFFGISSPRWSWSAARVPAYQHFVPSWPGARKVHDGHAAGLSCLTAEAEGKQVETCTLAAKRLSFDRRLGIVSLARHRHCCSAKLASALKVRLAWSRAASNPDLSRPRDRLPASRMYVEYFDDDGACYVTIFAGPGAEWRALHYGEALKALRPGGMSADLCPCHGPLGSPSQRQKPLSPGSQLRQ
jgi:hypothetical protein